MLKRPFRAMRRTLPDMAGRRLQSALFLVASLLPALVLVRLIVPVFYAQPETDDFCFAYHYAADGLRETISIFYQSVGGRALPMVIITFPMMISRAIGLDLFLVYPLVMAAFILAFIGSIAWTCRRLWPTASGPEHLFFTLTLAAVIGVNALNFRELFLWLPSVACYLVPAALFLVIFAALVMPAVEGAAITIRSTAILSVLCFLAASCNEFTLLWIMAIIAAAFVMRGFTQWGQHAALAVSALAGFLVVLAAPGNSVRMSQYPSSGRVWTAIDGTLEYFAHDWQVLFQQPSLLAWLGIVAAGSIFVIHPKPIRLWSAVVGSLGIPLLLFACSFVTWFVAYYATGDLLALRARNETAIFIIAGLTLSVATISRLISQSLPVNRPAGVQIIGAILCGLLGLHLIDGRTMGLLRSERSTFNTFWLESMQRHAALSLSSAPDIVVPNRSVRPSILMQEDLTDNPGRLPNDCVAAFYGKHSVIAK